MATPDFPLLVVGDDWPMVVTYTDPSEAPQSLDGCVVDARLFLRDQAQPIADLQLAAGSDLSIGKLRFVAPRTITAYAKPDPDKTAYFPTCLQIRAQDTLGQLRTLAVKTIQVVSPRFANSSSLPADRLGNIVSVALQGEPGPSISVNGHTGPEQTLTAADVGAATTDQFTALSEQIAALQAAVTALQGGSSSGGSTPAPGTADFSNPANSGLAAAIP